MALFCYILFFNSGKGKVAGSVSVRDLKWIDTAKRRSERTKTVDVDKIGLL